MPKSAIDRGSVTATRITRCAQQLTETNGLDGFTMEDVARCAGVSRRTLFNHVEGKLEAVLGAGATVDTSRLDQLRAGGPTGHLADDVKATFVALLDSRDAAPDDVERTRRLIGSDPRLQRVMHEKFARLTHVLAAALVERDPARFDVAAARTAATVALSLADLALDAYVADPGRSLATHYAAAFDAAAALLTSEAPT